MDSTYRARNDAARTRLATLIARLSPQDLDHPLGDGWTVKAALLHLAFWDRYAAAVAQQWQRTGIVATGVEDAYINLAALDDWLAATPEYALREVVRAAALADRTAAAVGDALHADLDAHGETWVCERSVHRAEHLEQIERLLPTRWG